MAEAPATAPTIEALEEQFDDAFAVAALAAEKGEPLPVDTPTGQDTAPAATGADTTPAATGAGTVPAGAGQDTAPAATGADTVPAATGADTVVAAAGKDTVPAATGADTTPAATGQDAVAAAPAVDTTPTPAQEPAKKREPTAEEIAARQALEEQLADYKFSDAETAAINKFKTDFPEESVAIDARFKAIERTITQRVYNSALAVLERVQELVTPAVQGYQATAQQQREAAINGAHSDYAAVRPKVQEWIKTQPPVMRASFEQALAQGSAEDVVGVVSLYKKATGAQQPPVVTTTVPAAPKGPSKDDVDALAPVGSKRVTPTTKGQPDPNDYDGAWREAAAAMK